MINIVLIPPEIYPVFENKNFMPLGLLAISANLRKNGYFPTVFKPDNRMHSNEFIKIAKDILNKNPQIIGFSTWCISYPASLLIARQIKKEAPEIPIVFGGPQASILPKETLQNFQYIDFVLAGEADYSFSLLIDELIKRKPDFKRIPGLTYRSNSGTIKQNPIKGAIENLDDLPIPAYDLVQGNKSLKMDVGRGCPFKCIYCTTNDFFSKKYRVKSVKRIIHEMNFAFETSKIKKFSFAHDMFTLNKKFIYELCSALIQKKKVSGINFTWTCSARIDCVSKEMLFQMKEAGCESIFFGIESGSEKIQKSIGKNLDIEKVYEVAEICLEAELKMYASFIIGFPDETKKDMEKSLQCALRLSTNGVLVQFSELSLLPGTPLFEKYSNELKYDGIFSSFSNKFCNQEEQKLIIEYPKIFSSFYHLPKKKLCHNEMSFLCHLINNMSHFRNTLFLLSKVLESDAKENNLLRHFKNKYNALSTDELSNTTVVSNWIRFLRTYIMENKEQISVPFITDIFKYEAFAASLTTLYSMWQLIHPKTKNHKLKENFSIKPTPIWKTMTTNFKLESALPNENRWKENTKRIRKGKYNYLLIAISMDKCKRIRINTIELLLLKNLSELSFSDYVQKVKSVLDEKDALLWLKRLRRWGVLEFTEIT